MKQLVIFDLDGTVLNTIADLGNSTNYALNQLGYPMHDIPSYRFRVGNGINKLFERALPEGEKSEENVLRVRQQFLPYYGEHCTDATQPYEGILELLHRLQSAGIRMAIASNKYQYATSKLIKHFYGDIPFVAIMGQQDGRPTKPNSAIVDEILNLASISKEDVLYVGDSGVDMHTAQNAHVEACGVTWGFRPIDELQEYNPAHIVSTPDDIYRLAMTD
jgi:phosphoglycolate phosphatase